MVNKVILQGRFCSDPKVENKGGFDMCEFTIAWSEKYKDKETQCFLRCKSWREQAKFVEQYFSKGQECVIEGKLQTESWEKDGQKQKFFLFGLVLILGVCVCVCVCVSVCLGGGEGGAKNFQEGCGTFTH